MLLLLLRVTEKRRLKCEAGRQAGIVMRSPAAAAASPRAAPASPGPAPAAGLHCIALHCSPRLHARLQFKAPPSSSSSSRTQSGSILPSCPAGRKAAARRTKGRVTCRCLRRREGAGPGQGCGGTARREREQRVAAAAPWELQRRTPDRVSRSGRLAQRAVPQGGRERASEPPLPLPLPQAVCLRNWLLAADRLSPATFCTSSGALSAQQSCPEITVCARGNERAGGDGGTTTLVPGHSRLGKLLVPCL